MRNKKLKKVFYTLDITPQIPIVIHMITNKTYTVTTADFSNSGEMLEQVRDFPKSREGLNAAYEFARPCRDWMIWFGNQVVDQSH